MPISKNQEVWIESDRKRYEEYRTEVEGNVVTCYIASEAGKIFKIGWRNHESPLLTSTHAIAAFDGIRTEAKTWDHEKGRYSGKFRGPRHDSKTYMPYKFANVVLTDNGGFTASEDMGTIVISLSHATVVPSSAKTSWRHAPDDFGFPLNEKSNKAGCHRIGLADVVPTPTKQWRSRATARKYGSDAGPYVTFRFVYRPMDFLQALEIVPVVRTERNKRTREPLSAAGLSNTTTKKDQCKRQRTSSIKREATDFSDFDQAERELLTQQAEVARKLKELRKRKNTASARVKQEVKVEDEIIPLDASGVIDLTLD